MIPDVVDARSEGVDDPDRAPVGDHENLLTRVEAKHICEERAHPGEEVLEGLGVVCPGALAFAPAPVRIGEALLDLSGRQSFPRSEAPLAQPRIDSDLEAQRRRDDVRRLARPGQVTRVDHVDAAVELLGERAGLLAAEVVQTRVGAPLPAAVAVPIRLAVPN